MIEGSKRFAIYCLGKEYTKVSRPYAAASVHRFPMTQTEWQASNEMFSASSSPLLGPLMCQS